MHRMAASAAGLVHPRLRPDTSGVACDLRDLISRRAQPELRMTHEEMCQGD